MKKQFEDSTTDPHLEEAQKLKEENKELLANEHRLQHSYLVVSRHLATANEAVQIAHQELTSANMELARISQPIQAKDVASKMLLTAGLFAAGWLHFRDVTAETINIISPKWAESSKAKLLQQNISQQITPPIVRKGFEWLGPRH